MRELDTVNSDARNAGRRADHRCHAYQPSASVHGQIRGPSTVDSRTLRQRTLWAALVTHVLRTLAHRLIRGHPVHPGASARPRRNAMHTERSRYPPPRVTGPARVDRTTPGQLAQALPSMSYRSPAARLDLRWLVIAG